MGAIVIIIYLVVSIFSLVPRKLRKTVETLPVCPDYWKLEKTADSAKTDMKNNITNYDKTANEDPDKKYVKGKNDQYILNGPEDINISTNDHVLDYKCVPDPNVYGDIYNLEDQLKLINENNNIYSRGTTIQNYKAKRMNLNIYMLILQIQILLWKNMLKLLVFIKIAGQLPPEI